MRCLMFALGLTGLFVTGVATGAEDDAEVKKELARFEGRWKFEAVEMKSEQQPTAEQLAKMRVEFKDGKMAFFREETKVRNSSFKVDPRQKHIDLVFERLPNQPEGSGGTNKVLGLYAFDGDKLKICLPGPPDGNERPRPTKIEAKKLDDGEQAVMVLAREKSK